jgi:alpha-L-rhamnosidase
MRNNLLTLSFLFVVFFGACTRKNQTQGIENLRCEFLHDPPGIDVLHPRLSWEIVVPGRAVMQQSYRIMVASTPELLSKNTPDLWNSGKIASDSSIGIRYQGKRLQSGQPCYWKVTVWTNQGTDSMSSEPARWSMGLLNPGDWHAQWIGLDTFSVRDSPYAPHTRLAARYFRKAFQTEKQVKRAVVYISGLGTYQLFLDGEKVGRAELSPDPTQYDKRVFYNTYELTDAWKKGSHALGVIVGNGRFFTMRGGGEGLPPITNFGFPKLRLQLEITYADGTQQEVISDTSWQLTTEGPILSNNEYDGEDYDVNREMPGWNTAGFDASAWQSAQAVEAPAGRLEAQMSPLITVMDTIRPKSVFQIAPGRYIVDMGQNMVGWSAVRMGHGQQGDTLTMRFAERLNPDSTLYTANLRSAEATDHYVMKDGAQQWEPHFTYHGFRYIEVRGYPGTPAPSDFTGKVVYDNLPTTGQFTTSNAIINEVYHNAYWGIRGNYRGMPTDCPQRDERMGWLGDRVVGSYGESFIFDNNALYAKWLQDISDAQREDGSVPDVAPSYWKIYSDNMTWPGAYLVIAHMLRHQFANSEPIAIHYASMKRWMLYMHDRYMKHGILTKDTYGDWCMPPEDPHLIHSKDPSRITPGAYLGTAFYYRMLSLMENFARLSGESGDVAMWRTQAAEVRRAFNEKFLQPGEDFYANNTATANIFALAYGLAPDSIRSKVFDHIMNTTLQDFHGHISTGLVGAQWLMRTLTRNGRPDIAYRLATNTTYPSWGYMAEHGATTIWELWNGNTADPAMNSGNHVMLLGDLVVWLYEDLAGIQADSSGPGFKQIVMRPYPVKGLDHVKASFHSVHGLIKSEWQVKDSAFDWHVTIPANTTARLWIPAGAADQVTEGGKDAASVAGVHFEGMHGDRAVYALGSGEYHFVSNYFARPGSGGHGL